MRWPWSSAEAAAQQCLGIELHLNKVFAVIRSSEGVTDYFCGAESAPDANGLDAQLDALGHWLKTHHHQELPTTIVLDSQYCETQLLEAPNVPDEELSNALQFRVKDLLGKDPLQVVVQAFRLPSDAYRGRMDMAYTNVVDKSHITQLVTWSRQQHLQLEVITLTELSLLNLVASQEPESSIAVVRLDHDAGTVYVMRDGGLYLTRTFNFGLKDVVTVDDGAAFQVDNSQHIDGLALELQRSMDYFESQLGMGSVGQIWVLMPDGVELDEALAQLEQAINIPVRLLSVESAFNRMSNDQMLTAGLASALGGSLAYELAG